MEFVLNINFLDKTFEWNFVKFVLLRLIKFQYSVILERKIMTTTTRTHLAQTRTISLTHTHTDIPKHTQMYKYPDIGATMVTGNTVQTAATFNAN